MSGDRVFPSLAKISKQKRRLEGEAHAYVKERVSVCIPNYNKGSYIEDCIKSVVYQTYKDLEIIIVDDCSSDNSREEINRCVRTYGGTVKIMTMFLPRRTGTAWAQNMAYYLAKGEYVCNMDSDDIIHKDKIKLQVEASKSGGYDVIGTNFKTFKGSLDHITNPNGGYWLEFEDDKIEDAYLFHKRHCVCFGSLLMRHDVIDMCGGMNKRFIGTEDFEIVHRIATLGYKIGNLNQTLYYYRELSTQRSRLFHSS